MQGVNNGRCIPTNGALNMIDLSGDILKDISTNLALISSGLGSTLLAFPFNEPISQK